MKMVSVFRIKLPKWRNNGSIRRFRVCKHAVRLHTSFSHLVFIVNTQSVVNLFVLRTAQQWAVQITPRVSQVDLCSSVEVQISLVLQLIYVVVHSGFRPVDLKSNTTTKDGCGSCSIHYGTNVEAEKYKSRNCAFICWIKDSWASVLSL